jgi:hypothetical protein
VTTITQARLDELVALFRHETGLTSQYHNVTTKGVRFILNHLDITVEPPVPPEPEGDVIAVTKGGCYWVPTDQDNSDGERLWLYALTRAPWSIIAHDYGPLTIYRREQVAE